MIQLLKFKNSSNQKGFTLIELIVVITLIGIMVPAMTLMYSNILESYRKMREIQSVTEKFDFTLDRVTEDLNKMTSLQIADDKSIKFVTTPGDTTAYMINDDDNTLKLCVENCDSYTANFYELTNGIDANTVIKYYDGGFVEVNTAEGPGWNSEEDPGDINTIKYVSLKLVINYQGATTKMITIVYPENKVDLDS
jgi:prepilin-type N-terminal cleavage/methylation domain-containing protein